MNKIRYLAFICLLVMGFGRSALAAECIVTNASDIQDPEINPGIPLDKLTNIVGGKDLLTFRTALYLVRIAGDSQFQGLIGGLKDFCKETDATGKVVRHIRFKDNATIDLTKPLPFLMAPAGESLLITVDAGKTVTLDGAVIPADSWKDSNNKCGLGIALDPNFGLLNTADNTKIMGQLIVVSFPGAAVCVAANNVLLDGMQVAANLGDGFSVTGKSAALSNAISLFNGGNGFTLSGGAASLSNVVAFFNLSKYGIEINSSNNKITSGKVSVNGMGGIHIASGQANTISQTIAVDNNDSVGGKGIILEDGANDSISAPISPTLNYDSETGNVTGFIAGTGTVEAFWAESKGIAEGSETQARYFIPNAVSDGKFKITDQDLLNASGKSDLGNKSKIFFTFTATDASGNTSEFSPAVGYPFADEDGDGVADETDNCLTKPNADQVDFDGDGVGDACDNCLKTKNPGQEDKDGNGAGDVCDYKLDTFWKSWKNNTFIGNSIDISQFTQPQFILPCFNKDNPNDCDFDGVEDYIDLAGGGKKQFDNCLGISNKDQLDQDQDGQGDACDKTPCPDGKKMGADGVTCELDCGTWGHPNADKTACELNDTDGDGVGDILDNCDSVKNPEQEAHDDDVNGDACDDDDDNDTVLDGADNCPLIANMDQADLDKDGTGDVCDLDKDGDDHHDFLDNCPLVANNDQKDTDGDGVGDACQTCPEGQALKDGKCEVVPVDQCPDDSAKTEPGVCGCGVADTDGDGDGVPDCKDNCPTVANADQNPDACKVPPPADDDGDGVVNAQDNCPVSSNPDQADKDGDGVGDICDLDNDGDGVLDLVDNCPAVANADQADMDLDNVGDACDSCPKDPSNDEDKDGVCGDVDNCPTAANVDQADANGDGQGDVCQTCQEGQAPKDGKCEVIPPPECPDGQVKQPDGSCAVPPPPECQPQANEIKVDGKCSACADGTHPDDAKTSCVPTVVDPGAGTGGTGGTVGGGTGGTTGGTGGSDGTAGTGGDSGSNGTGGTGGTDTTGGSGGADGTGGTGGTTVALDQDEDGVADSSDNCPAAENPEQIDTDGNGIGDVCDDRDDDGLLDISDPDPDTHKDDMSEDDFGGLEAGGSGCTLMTGETKGDPSPLFLLLMSGPLFLIGIRRYKP